MKRNGSDGRRALVVALTLLLITGLLVFLFVIGRETPGGEPGFPPDTARGLLSTGGVTPSTFVGAPLPAFFLGTYGAGPVVEATLSNDQDHDGKYDGMADPLGVLLCALVVLAAHFVVLRPPVSGFLPRFGEPPVSEGSDHHPALERPG